VGRVLTSDPDVMSYRSGGGCLMLFGLPFLVAGLFSMLSPLLPQRYRPRESKTGRPVPVAGAVALGGLFAAVGAGLMFGRSGKDLDRRTDTLTTWWGVVVPFRRKVYRLSDVQRVSLTREVRRSRNSSYTVFPVRLHGLNVILEESRDPDKARAAAEQVAKFLGCPLADSSLGTQVVREAAELDESVRERVRRTGERPEVPPPPACQRCRTRVVADTLCVEIPPPGFRAWHVVPLVAALGMPVFAAVVFVVPLLQERGMPTAVKVALVAFIGVFFIAIPVLMGVGFATRGVRVRKTVEVSPRELRVITRGAVRRKAVAIPADELEELLVVPAKRAAGALARSGKVVLARSDRAKAVFGEGLPDEELAWLRAVVWNVVSA